MPDADERESRCRHTLGGPPFYLSGDEIDLWLEKHTATEILGAVAVLDRREQAGKVIDHKIAYVEGILADRKTARGGKHASGEPAIAHPLDWHFDILRRDADAAGVERPGEYADDVMRSQQLAREVAAMEEGPERDGLVAKWRKLP